jgi:glucose-1-phosphate cytidylyltransferase
VTPKVVILCGGRGARLQEHTESIPKPMVQIGGRPILWHVLGMHLHQGFREFVLLTGYRSEQIEAFVRDTAWPADARIRCLDTGRDTPTGGRLWQAGEQLADGTFCLSYADAVSDVNLAALVFDHDRNVSDGAAATMTVVRPQLPFGVALLADGSDRVAGFAEKPVVEQWINAGFFVLEPAVLELLGPDSVLERAPLQGLAVDGRLRAHRHGGFWHCMDTYKDAVALNDVWDRDPGGAPWLAHAAVGG